MVHIARVGAALRRLSTDDLLLLIGALEGRIQVRPGALSCWFRPDYGPAQAAMIFGFVKGLVLDGITTVWPNEADAPERADLYTDRVEDVRISGFPGKGIGQVVNLPAKDSGKAGQRNNR